MSTSAGRRDKQPCEDYRYFDEQVRRKRPYIEPMKLHYYPETDNLYVEFKPEPGADTIEVTPGLNVDVDAAGEVVGFDIDHASRRLDLGTLEATALPLHTVKAQ